MVVNISGGDHKEWLAPAPSCAVRYINDPWYLPEDTARETERLTKRWENIVQFLKGR